MSISTLHLTCADEVEAAKIANELLGAKLAACVKQQPLTSSFWWQGSIETAQEVLLIIETRTELFAQIEQKVRELHSYDTFVLIEYKATNASEGVGQWLNDSIKK